jgi:hypothetical protein
LLRLINRGDALSSFQISSFRAGHAHAGIFLLLALQFYVVLDSTTLPELAKQLACAVFAVGIVLQSGGFFLAVIRGASSRSSVAVTSAGAVLLATAIAVLVYGLIARP